MSNARQFHASFTKATHETPEGPEEITIYYFTPRVVADAIEALKAAFADPSAGPISIEVNRDLRNLAPYIEVKW